MTRIPQLAIRRDHAGLARLITDGVCTIEDIMLEANGLLTQDDRQAILDNVDTDGTDFAKAKKKDVPGTPKDVIIQAYQNYLLVHEIGRFRQEAIRRIQELSTPTTPGPEESGRPDPGSRSVPEGTDPRAVKRLVNDIKKVYADKAKTAEQQKNTICDIIKERLASTEPRNRVQTKDIYDIIKNDHNLFSVSIIQELNKLGIISYDGLVGLSGITDDFIDAIYDRTVYTQPFSSPAPLNNIKMESTEIYFWGLPSSGKSCIIGAVLSQLFRSGLPISKNSQCNGYDYFNVMQDCFSENGVISLPPGTPLKDCYEMGFTLTDERNRRHPITIIDLAGEMLRAMYISLTNPDSLTDDQKEALATADSILATNASRNHKIHFFVVEYGADELIYENRSHLAYLVGAMDYLRNLQVFKRLTDAVCIVLSKADRAPFAHDPDCMLKFGDYLNGNLSGFVKGIEELCRINHIERKGKFVFTLGDVCFQNFCKVAPEPSMLILNKIVELTGTSISNRVLRGLLN